MRILLKEKMDEAKLSQTELAVLSGVAQQTISSILSGARKDPRLSTLSDLAAALGCKVTDLYEEDGTEGKSDNVDAFGAERGGADA